MEVKKSHKADLEHRRPYVFAAAFVAVTLVFVGVLFVPFKSIGQWASEFFDDYSMDLDLKLNEKDDMISAALPEQPKPEQKEAEKLNKVDEAAETEPEELEPVAMQEEAKEQQEEMAEEEQPINLNKDEATLRIVEELPEYPGGMVEFMKWLTATLRYPDAAIKQRIEGRVMVSFIVNKDGTLSDIKVTQGVHKLLDEEALRVCRLMPEWKPGKENGENCRTMVAIPIIFEI